jgi:hypothetical protein
MPSVFGECTGARMVTPLMVTLLPKRKKDKKESSPSNYHVRARFWGCDFRVHKYPYVQ